MEIKKEQPMFDEWSHLMIDTYNQLKHEQIQENDSANRQTISLDIHDESWHKIIKKYFGELEIRGLIIISYYALNYSDNVDPRISRKCSKMIILLS